MKHTHNYNIEKKASERKTFFVLLLTFATMVVEIITGWLYNSIALLSDGWHMSTHATALGLTLAAYYFARKYASDKRFVFGTWKIEILGAFTSSILLGLVGLYVLGISIERFLAPEVINYNYALLVAIIGFVVNLVSALILNHSHEHHHEHKHEHKHEHHHEHKHEAHDLNLRSAYMHVIADALTSVFAIVALLGAKYLNWNWLDPLMGLIGAALIFSWAFSLVKETSAILLDKSSDNTLQNSIVHKIESDNQSKVEDLHLWRVAQDKYACVLSIFPNNSYSISDYRNRLLEYNQIVHLTIELEK